MAGKGFVALFNPIIAGHGEFWLRARTGH